jgi:hypothetical protein
MTVFRASAAFLAAGFAVLAIQHTGPDAGMAAEAPSSIRSILLAQAKSPGNATGPIQLGPRREVQAPSAVIPGTRPPESRRALILVPVFPSEGGGGPVQTETLNELNGDSIGTLDDDSGGLGSAMWQGTDRAFVERLFALLPQHKRSPAMRALARRVLLTSAAAPAGQSEGPSLLALRIGALFSAGELKSAQALIAVTPAGEIKESLIHMEIEAFLFRFNTASACEIVRGPGQEFNGLFWQQASAFCLALSDKRSEAAMISDLLAERGEAVHPAFFATMERLSGAAPPLVESLKDPTALHLTMMRAANLALPVDAAEKASPAALQAIALSPNAPVGIRLVAAEAAVLLGTLSPSVLLQIYGAVSLEKGDFQNAAERAEADWGPKGRALITRAALAAQTVEARARLLQKGFAIARSKGDTKLMFIAAQLILAGVQPSADLAWFATDAVRAYIMAGDLDTASKWLALVNNDQTSEDLRAALWPYVILMSKKAASSGTLAATSAETPGETSGATSSETPTILSGGIPTIKPTVIPPTIPAVVAIVEPGITSAEVNNWWRVLDLSGVEVVSRARILFSLFEALSLPVSSGLWARVIDSALLSDARGPSDGIRNALRHAIRIKSRGATAGFALVAIGPEGPGPENLQAVEQAISGLRAVGLEAEARQLALEAAVAAGL